MSKMVTHMYKQNFMFRVFW